MEGGCTRAAQRQQIASSLTLLAMTRSLTARHGVKSGKPSAKQAGAIRCINGKIVAGRWYGSNGVIASAYTTAADCSSLTLLAMISSLTERHGVKNGKPSAKQAEESGVLTGRLSLAADTAVRDGGCKRPAQRQQIASSLTLRNDQVIRDGTVQRAGAIPCALTGARVGNLFTDTAEVAAGDGLLQNLESARAGETAAPGQGHSASRLWVGKAFDRQ